MENRWICEDLDGGWIVTTSRNTSWKKLQLQLRPLLSELEGELAPAGSRSVLSELSTQNRQAIELLRIGDLWKGPTQYPGSVYFLRDDKHSGAWVDTTGAVLNEWLGAWLDHHDQADLLLKLGASTAAERHLFIAIPPDTVVSDKALAYLMDSDRAVPVAEPDVPTEITDLWIADDTTFNQTGLRWSRSNGWSTFDKLVDGRDLDQL